jgi:pimeloyl-ACP methyl ester carboxylesterase
MAYADTNGQRIFYTDHGEGPPVLFSHGFFMDHEMWAPQVDAFADRYRCITWDERGWGQTVADDAAFDYWDLAADGVALLDHLDIESAVWCGMSQGGFLSLRAALAHPERVRALVLIDTSPAAESPETTAMYRAMFDQAVTGGLDDELTAAIAGFLFAPTFDSALWRGKWAAKPPLTINNAFDCMVERDDVSDRLGEIACPVLVIHGEHDITFPADEAAAWAAGLTDLAEFVRDPDAGHTANLENPHVTNEALGQFLTSLT